MPDNAGKINYLPTTKIAVVRFRRNRRRTSQWEKNNLVRLTQITLVKSKKLTRNKFNCLSFKLTLKKY